MAKLLYGKHIRRKPRIENIADHQHFRARVRCILPVDVFKGVFFTYFDLVGGIRQQNLYYRAIWCYGLRKISGISIHDTMPQTGFRESHYYDYLFYARSCMLKYRKEYNPQFVEDWRGFRDFCLRLVPAKTNQERKKKYNDKKRKERLKKKADAARALRTYHRNKHKKPRKKGSDDVTPE